MNADRNIRWCIRATAGIAVAFAAVLSTARANVEDPALSNTIDKLADVVKRLEFDQRRMQGYEYLDGWDRILKLNLCGAIAVSATGEGLVHISQGLAAGVEVDPTFMESQEVRFGLGQGLAAKAGVYLLGNPRTAACVDVSPWLLAFFYKEYHGQLPPLEAFSYQEHDALVDSGAEFQEFEAPLTAMKTPSLDDAAIDSNGGMSALSDDANAFLRTSAELVFGSREDAHTRFVDLPIYQNLIGPIDDFMETVASETFPRVENGVLSGVDVVGTGIEEVEQVFLQSGDLLGSGGDALGVFAGMASAMEGILPLDMDFGAIKAGVEGLTLEDINPCAMTGRESFADAILPEFIKVGVQEACGGAGDAVAWTAGQVGEVVDFANRIPDVVDDVQAGLDSIDVGISQLDQISDYNDTIHEKLGRAQTVAGTPSHFGELGEKFKMFMKAVTDMIDSIRDILD